MEQPQGPSPETLRHLHGMLPSFVKGMKEKRAVGKGKPVGVMKARKVCPVCSKLYDKIWTSADIILESKNCERCQEFFDDGCIALVCGDKFAFVKSPRFATIPQKIVHLSPQNMEKVQKEFDAKWERNEPDA